MATQLVKLDDRAKGVQGLFTVNMAALVKTAPRNVGDPNRLVRMAFNTIAYNPDLLQCTHQSLLAGVMEAVKMGLAVGGPMQECFLIPFRNSGVLEATLIVGYQGYRNLVDRAKSVMDLHPRAVYANDSFDVEFGTHPRITHKPYALVGATEPGPLVAVYAVAHLRGGGIQSEVMFKAEVDQHRAMSRAANKGPWVTHYDAMALKTVLRKIVKYLPKQSEVMEALARAMQLDDRADRGEAQYPDTDLSGMQVFDVEPVPASRPRALDALKARVGEPPTSEPPLQGANAEQRPVTKNAVPISAQQAAQEVKAGLAVTVTDEGKAAQQKVAEALAKGASQPADPTSGDFFTEGMDAAELRALDREIAERDAKQ